MIIRMRTSTGIGFYVYLIVCIILLVYSRLSSSLIVDELVRQWAPLVFISHLEKYWPSGVEHFLSNVFVGDANGTEIFPYLSSNVSEPSMQKLYLITRQPVDRLLKHSKSFIYGENTFSERAPVYAIVTHCGLPENLHFHVTYWFYYPFNEGKKICLDGRTLTFTNNCKKFVRTFGNHVSDWERLSLYFIGKNEPESMYLAHHEGGTRFIFLHKQRIFIATHAEKGKPLDEVRLDEFTHPVVFSAEGSHGLWPNTGEHMFFPRFLDTTDKGFPWKTWKNLSIYHLGYDPLPYWMNFGGKWGNPKKNCIFAQCCEYANGPNGIIRDNHDFKCSYNH